MAFSDVLSSFKLSKMGHTVTAIDDRGANEPKKIQFSNFRITEDADTGQIVLIVNVRVLPDERGFNSGLSAGWHTCVIEVK